MLHNGHLLCYSYDNECSQNEKQKPNITIGQSNRTFVQTGKICTSYTHIHDRLFSWVGIYTGRGKDDKRNISVLICDTHIP